LLSPAVHWVVGPLDHDLVPPVLHRRVAASGPADQGRLIALLGGREGVALGRLVAGPPDPVLVFNEDT
jgi:hypothetical protein